MKEVEKQALIEHAKSWLADAEAARDEIPFGFDEGNEKEVSLIKIALTALTAQPVCFIHPIMLNHIFDGSRTCGRVWGNSVDEISNEGRIPLFTGPAPAVSLAELVPDEKTEEQFEMHRWAEKAMDIREVKGWNDCRAAILRSIEEAK